MEAAVWEIWLPGCCLRLHPLCRSVSAFLETEQGMEGVRRRNDCPFPSSISVEMQKTSALDPPQPNLGGTSLLLLQDGLRPLRD